MKKALLVSYSFMTRVVVDEKATEDQIIIASKKMMRLKVDTELGENLEEIEDDTECPIGTFVTDLPTIDRVILNPLDKEYILMGKGLPVQVKKFDGYGDWDSVNNIHGEPVFDIQMDEDEYIKEGELSPCFQYVNLLYNDGEYEMGEDYQNVPVEVVTEKITEVLSKLLQKSLDKSN